MSGEIKRLEEFFKTHINNGASVFMDASKVIDLLAQAGEVMDKVDFYMDAETGDMCCLCCGWLDHNNEHRSDCTLNNWREKYKLAKEGANG